MSAREALARIASIPRDCGEPVFAEPWEARAFALAVHLNERGVFTWSEWAEIFGANLKANTLAGEPASYYEVWWQTLEEMGERHGLATSEERSVRSGEWRAAAARTPHGKPIEL